MNTRSRKHKARDNGVRLTPRPQANSIGRAPRGKRDRGILRSEQYPFVPPEDWHEPTGEAEDYRIIVQPPGEGYRHIITPADVRARLAKLPATFLDLLEVVQFSRMTRKKQTYPCYGMQWGAAIYLYPIEDGLVEHFPRPPQPGQMNEARMYGGRWVQEGTTWRLRWTDATLRDFYLNNVLIHELGHLLDDRNRGYQQRERYAEWFALRYGFQATDGGRGRKRRKVVRRHHSK